MRSVRLLIAALLAMPLAACAQEWPQFQGPSRNGISVEKGLADSWGPQGPKTLWSAPLSAGFGGPAVQDGKVYLLDRAGETQDVLRCLDLATGKELWTYTYDAPGKIPFPGPRCTPALDDKNVYTVGPFGQVNCISKETHKPVWTHNLLKDFGTKLPTWGVAQSAFLYGDHVILAPQSDKVGLVAYNKSDGSVVWTSDPIGPMAYQSPYVTKVLGVEQVIMASGALDKDTKTVCVVGVDAKDGKTLWQFKGWSCQIPIPSPTSLGDGRFFLTADYKAGCAMFKVSREGQAWKAEKLFANPNCESKIHDMIYEDGYLFGNSSANKHGLVCLNTDGQIVWATDAKGKKDGIDFDQGGAVLIADGKIFAMAGKGGTLYMFKASHEKMTLLAKAKVLDGEMVWAPMALADGKLLCRDQKQIKCLDLKAAR